MSYVAPSTRSTGNLITAAIWNQDIRDNRNFLHNCPAVQVYKTGNQTISNNTQTILDFGAEIFDSDGLHDSVNPAQINIKDDGIYFIHAMIKWASGAASLRGVLIAVSVGSFPIAQNYMRNASTAAVEMSISAVYQLRASIENPITIQVYQNTGGNLDIVSDGTFRSRLGVCWIGSGS